MQKRMSLYEYTEANKFINRLYQQYGVGLEFEECLNIAWLEYAEARNLVSDIYNSETLWIYAQKRIADALIRQRKIRNARIGLEARLSLDQSYCDSDETIASILVQKKGNFVNALCLWLDIERMDALSYKIIRMLYNGSEDLEVMQWMNLEPPEYYEKKRNIRELLEQYIRETEGYSPKQEWIREGEI